MAFETYEESVEHGQPVELYVFGYQGGVFRYTSDADDFTLSGQIYEAVPGLSRSPIDDTGDVAKSSLTVTAPEDFYISKLFEVYPPSDVVELSVYRLQRSDPSDIKTMWLGRVLNATWGVGYSQLLCESMQTRLKQPGLRRIYSKNCPHLLYGSDCRASQILFEDVVEIEAITNGGFHLHSSSFGAAPTADYYAGGKIAFDAGGGIIERRGIREHVGDVIVITHPIPSLLQTSTISAWPGCNRTLSDCRLKFNNVPNFGGMPYMVEKNPFGQSSVY